MAAARSSRAALFGLSDGGRAAVAFAAAHPGRTRGLVLYGTSYRGPRDATLRRYRSMVRHWGEGRIVLGAMTDDDMRTALARLIPEFRARAGQGERLGTMPGDLVRRAQAAGLFRLNLPRSLGGLELEPASTAEIFEEISRADGSAGWTMVTGNSTAFFAWLDPAVAREMIGGDPGFVSTSMWAPLGRAVPAGSEGSGRVTVTGRWPFNSGCPHASWLQVGVLSDADPPWRFAFVPAVVENTWDAMGLRGTGSHHLSLTGIPVPAEHLAAMFLAAVPLGARHRPAHLPDLSSATEGRTMRG
jgi:alkylation response protein AidB-like acyl-CoA dehydrogenase